MSLLRHRNLLPGVAVYGRCLLLALLFVLGACVSSDPASTSSSRGDQADQGSRRDIGIIPDNTDVGSSADDGASSSDGISGDTGLDAVGSVDAEPTADTSISSDTGRDADTCEGSSCGPPEGACCVEDCLSGPSCVTRPGGCQDVCESSALRTGRDCVGCGAADAAGACVDDAVYACTQAEHDECLVVPCGGETYYCTQIGGEWAWRTEPACGQTDSCARPGTCAGGTCVGTTPSSCGPSVCPADRCEGGELLDYSGTCDTTCDGAGGCTPCECTPAVRSCALPETNECCVPTCDPISGCASATGTCGTGVDVCTDPNRLQLADRCTGCGSAGASGTCAGGSVEVCDASSGGLCRQVSCGGESYTCAAVGGVWQWRRSNACDDGKLCTHTDVCVGPGNCAGTDIVCTGDACVDRECNGTATCSSTVRVGNTCDDGDVCTDAEVCSATGVCGGGRSVDRCGDSVCNCGETNATCAADCPIVLPANACSNGSQSRSRCSGARTIGRQDARDGWTSGQQNTCSSARNDFDGECGGLFDVGSEHMYAIYLLAGERVDAELFVGSTRCSDVRGERVELSARLKFRFNPDTTAAGAASCPQFIQCSGGPTYPQTFANIRSYTATQDGWLFVIVDGGSTAFNEDRGYYTLNATLSRCESADCGCP